MATDNGWTIPTFRFEVDFGTGLNNVQFQEVTGLDIETQEIEYRKGNSAGFAPIKMPGLSKSGNVTLKRGIFAKDNMFWNWFQQIKANAVQKAPLNIKLLDENGSVTMQWQLNNAWPTKISSTDLNGQGNEVTVDAIEIIHEGLTVANK